MVDRSAVLSDVHAHPFALCAVLTDARLAGVDLIVNLCDLMADLWPVQTVEELDAAGPPVVSVRGNGDRAMADAHGQRPGWTDDVPAPARTMVTWAAPQERALVESLPLWICLTIAGLGEADFCHTPRSTDKEAERQQEFARRGTGLRLGGTP